MYCQSCKSTERLHKSGSYTRKDGSIKQNYRCTTCQAKRQSDYRKTEKGKLAVSNWQKKFRLQLDKTDPRYKDRVWREALQVPTKPCRDCGMINTHRHHPDYSQPLDVIFLCPYHHRQEHKAIKITL